MKMMYRQLILALISLVPYAFGYIYPNDEYYRSKALPPCRNYTLDSQSRYELEACWHKQFVVRFHNRTIRKFSYALADSAVNILELCLVNQPQANMCPMLRTVRSDHPCAYMSRTCDNLLELCFNSNFTLLHGRLLGSGSHTFSVGELSDFLAYLQRYVYPYRVLHAGGW